MVDINTLLMKMIPTLLNTLPAQAVKSATSFARSPAAPLPSDIALSRLPELLRLGDKLLCPRGLFSAPILAPLAMEIIYVQALTASRRMRGQSTLGSN